MAASMKLTLRLVFADDTKQTLTINNINPDDGVANDIKQQIMTFNSNRGGELSTKLKSKLGANWIGIDSVKTTKTTRTYYF